MRQTALIAALTCMFLVVPALASQDSPGDKEENATMELYARSLGLHYNLHGWKYSFANSTKGITLQPRIAERGSTAHPPDSPYASDNEAELHDRYCLASAVLLAKALSATVAVTPSKTLVYTKNAFQITRVIKAPVATEPGGYINVVQIGGELEDQGERIGVHMKGLVPFVAGQTYLLFLSKPAQTQSPLFTLQAEHENLRIVANQVLPSRQSSTGPFVYGERFSDLVARVVAASSKAPCPQ